MSRLLPFALPLWLACSSPAATTVVTDTSVDSGVISCEGDSRAMSYSPNLTVAGTQQTKLVLVSAAPSPPARGTNAWTIKVTDAGGAPISGATVTAKPFMPDHGHGSTVQPTVTPNPDGTFTVSGLYLFMPGLWQVTFVVTAGAVTDSVVFSFCIAG